MGSSQSETGRARHCRASFLFLWMGQEPAGTCRSRIDRVLPSTQGRFESLERRRFPGNLDEWSADALRARCPDWASIASNRSLLSEGFPRGKGPPSRSLPQCLGSVIWTGRGLTGGNQVDQVLEVVGIRPIQFFDLSNGS